MIPGAKVIIRLRTRHFRETAPEGQCDGGKNQRTQNLIQACFAARARHPTVNVTGIHHETFRPTHCSVALQKLQSDSLGPKWKTQNGKLRSGVSERAADEPMCWPRRSVEGPAMRRRHARPDHAEGGERDDRRRRRVAARIQLCADETCSSMHERAGGVGGAHAQAGGGSVLAVEGDSLAHGPAAGRYWGFPRPTAVAGRPFAARVDCLGWSRRRAAFGGRSGTASARR
jgi:hypothetical protein